MGRIILVTGGSRSGKSAYAQKLAESLPGRRVFIATASALDDEMRDRIRKHQQARLSSHWDTIEENTDVAGALRSACKYDVFLVDCLTMWVNNLMYQAQQKGEQLAEETISERCTEIISACRDLPGIFIFVTNEVGMGIVPDTAIARRFVELAGRCNQAMAAASEEVTFITCGLPLHVKRSPS